VLHGGGGSGKQIHKSLSYDTLARKHGFIVVYPDGLERHWNDGRNDSKTPFFKKVTPDDVGFLRAIAGKLIANGRADARRIMVTGVSNGGMMTQRLMCQASDVFSAGASIIAGLPAALRQCLPERQRSLLLINGDNDPLMPWNGGGVGFRGVRGTVLSGPDTFAHWKSAYDCSGPVVSTPMKDRNKSDQSHPVLMISQNCAQGSKVHMVHIHGGGHNVPGVKKKGRRSKFRKKLLGPTNIDFDAQRMVVRFLGLNGD
jgi:polyhydroxybutyrate depolymerase